MKPLTLGSSLLGIFCYNDRVYTEPAMLRRLLGPHGQRGQAAIFVTMSIIPTLGMLGLVVDVGWAFWRKEAAQTAAQAGATAAAKAASSAPALVCSAGGSTPDPAKVQCAASFACPSTLNNPANAGDYFDVACLYAKQNGFTNGSSSHNVTQSVVIIADVRGGTTATRSFSGLSPDYWISVVATERMPELFSAVMGNTFATVSARATSAVFIPPDACIYGLNRTDPDTVWVTGSSSVTTTCGVFDNSTDPAALEATGGGSITASKMNVVGGFSNNGGTGTLSPTPTTGAAVSPDPLAGIPVPVVPNRCDSNGVSSGDSITMGIDGFYVICGNIHLVGNGTTTFPSGMYVIKNGGITINNGTVNGNGVTFYLTASPASQYSGVAITGGTDTLTAPTTGPYKGVLFYQDRTLPTSSPSSTFTGGSTMTLTGTLYFPTTDLTYTGGSASNPAKTGIVADQVKFSGSSFFAADPNGALTGLGVPIVSMVQ